MLIVDTNIILRYLLNDHEVLSPRAKDIITSGDILIIGQVVAEAIYVLSSVYKFPREAISKSLITIFNMENVMLENKEIVTVAVNEFKDSTLDFVDILLCAYSKATGDKVATFDKKLNNKLDTLK